MADDDVVPDAAPIEDCLVTGTAAVVTELAGATMALAADDDDAIDSRGIEPRCRSRSSRTPPDPVAADLHVFPVVDDVTCPAVDAAEGGGWICKIDVCWR